MRKEELRRRQLAARVKMNDLIQETERVRNIAENAAQVLDDLDEQFSQITSLNKTDFVFLFLGTALQVMRWVLAPRIGEAFDSDERLKENDKAIKNEIKKKNKEYQAEHKEKWGNATSDKGHKDWQAIIFSKPPFDTMDGAANPIFQPPLGLSGNNHRIKTLGHDPILGWIFGTVNIMTDTATLNNLRTFDIENGAFMRETTLIAAFKEFYESSCEDWHRIPAAVFAEGVHLKSDEFTKIGLPIPVLSVFSEELSKKLCKAHYDKLCLARDLRTIGKQATLSIIINMIISAVHGLFYKPEEMSMDLYAVKTHKILLYSNLIASASNVIYVAVATYLGDGKAWQKLDIGGILVTLWRLFTDVKFIYKVKEEFITSHFDQLIRGDREDFNRSDIEQRVPEMCLIKLLEE